MPKALTLRATRGLMINALTLITPLSLTQEITVSEKLWSPGTLQPLTRRTILVHYQDNTTFFQTNILNLFTILCILIFHIFNSFTIFQHSLFPFEDCSAGSRKLEFFKTLLARVRFYFYTIYMINPGYGSTIFLGNFSSISCLKGILFIGCG